MERKFSDPGPGRRGGPTLARPRSCRDPGNKAVYSKPAQNTIRDDSNPLGPRAFSRTGPEFFVRTDPEILGNPFPPGGGDQGIRKTNPKRGAQKTTTNIFAIFSSQGHHF